MNKGKEHILKDIQSEPDTRNIPIDRVGIKDISYPLSVLDRQKGSQHTVARVNMYVALPHNFRGTHMSRFVEVLNSYPEISTHNIPDILNSMKERLDAETAFFEISFPYFITKSAPVSGAQSQMEYICSIKGDSSVSYYTISVKVPVLTLCPCSKEISMYGAHNQRSFVTIAVKTTKKIWFEDIIAVAEDAASSEVYTLLKREDEKAITEKSYENPRFVEDLVRGIAESLNTNKDIIGFVVESENQESIHNHSAYAMISSNFN
jgi:GTP cyclohydrolase I